MTPSTHSRRLSERASPSCSERQTRRGTSGEGLTCAAASAGGECVSTSTIDPSAISGRHEGITRLQRPANYPGAGRDAKDWKTYRCAELTATGRDERTQSPLSRAG